jgi:hypothetical protein
MNLIKRTMFTICDENMEKDYGLGLEKSYRFIKGKIVRRKHRWYARSKPIWTARVIKYLEKGRSIQKGHTRWPECPAVNRRDTTLQVKHKAKGVLQIRKSYRDLINRPCRINP